MSEAQYLSIMKRLLIEGKRREGRNGATYGLFGAQMRFNLAEGFPLLTTKTVHMKSIIVELLWFLRGDSNIKFLKDHNISIWDEWADEQGELGPVYGMQWRSWPSYGPEEPGYIDQISELITNLKNDPYSRRHIVSAWNVGELDQMALPPCHCLFQFCVIDNKLHLQLYQRSADWFLGVPFNIASYALLLILVAKEVGLEAGDFIHTFGDLHLYENHIEQAKEQLNRSPNTFPKLVILNERKSIFDYKLEDFALDDYYPHPAIKAAVSA